MPSSVTPQTPPPLCQCGCGEPCAESLRVPGTYTRYVNDLHRKQASRQRLGKTTAPLRPPTHCACGCKKRLPPYRGTGKYTRFLPNHAKRVSKDPARSPNIRVPGDLTSAQIDAIIRHHRAVLRYERNRQR